MVGNDDTYEYLINIIPDYGGVPGSETEPAEMPKGTSASLIRTLKEGDRKSHGSMIFSTHTGMKNRVWMLGLQKNSSISFMDVDIHIHHMQCLSLWQETALEAFLMTTLICFMKKPANPYTLIDKTRLFTSMSWMLDERDKIIIRPASVDARDGLTIVYRNDKFGLYTSAKTELFDCVYETEEY